MSIIPVVENPRGRRRRRGGYTAKQLAAGFGGKRKMSGRKSSGRRRRRNPDLATYYLTGNPRKRHRARVYSGRRRRHSRRYSNPSMKGILGSIASPHTLKMAAGMAIGITAGKYVPGNLIVKVWPGVPQTGIAGVAVRIGTAVLLSEVTRRFVKQPDIANGILIGSIGYELYNLAAAQLLPKLGISGLGNGMNPMQRSLQASEYKTKNFSGGIRSVEPGLAL